MNQYLNGEELKQKIIRDQVSQVEQRIKNMQRSMNAELDSLLSQLQHLEEMAANENPEANKNKRSDSSSEHSLRMRSDTWEYIPDVLKVKDVQDLLKIGRNQAYDLVRSEQFYCVKVGRKTLIPKPGFIAWLEGNEF